MQAERLVTPRQVSFRLSLVVYLVATNRGPGGQGTGQRRACSGMVVIYFRARQVIENNGSYVTDQQDVIEFLWAAVNGLL